MSLLPKFNLLKIKPFALFIKVEPDVYSYTCKSPAKTDYNTLRQHVKLSSQK